jgi:hypothetical protein
MISRSTSSSDECPSPIDPIARDRVLQFDALQTAQLPRIAEGPQKRSGIGWGKSVVDQITTEQCLIAQFWADGAGTDAPQGHSEQSLAMVTVSVGEVPDGAAVSERTAASEPALQPDP